MNAVHLLQKLGQSIWYDNIDRLFVRDGGLQKLVDEGLTGVTSNPTIFDKAITGSKEYEEQIRELVRRTPSMTPREIIRALMIDDIRLAADCLMPVYRRSGGRDGFVSIEVTPSKARDTRGTIEEVRELWRAIDRRNLMVKIPATKEGLPAIETAIAEGMNINVTLIFSVERYSEVAHAYIAGLERRRRDGASVAEVASVASVFVSRIDTLVDDLLQEKGDRFAGAAGKAAVANTKMVYQAYKDIFSAEPFTALRAQGAAVQRPLWGSTGTKNPAYSDLLYVENLVGPDTVNTVPPGTYAAILDHLKPAATLEKDLDAAREVLHRVTDAGIDMHRVTAKLEIDGVAAFEKSFDGLERYLETKKHEVAAGP
jgi:transaldolase